MVSRKLLVDSIINYLFDKFYRKHVRQITYFSKNL